jgi:alpha-tubulin suppressor-like RCC1 family protein
MRKFLLLVAVCLNWPTAHAAEPLLPVVLSSLAPAEVSEDGGAHLHLYGQNFVPPLKVYVGWDDCDHLNIISTEELECIVPPHAQGYTSLMIRRGGERPVLRKNWLLYTPDLLTLTPATVDTMTRKVVKFKTSGGTPPYSYATLDGPGKIDSSSGELSSDTPGSGVVRVTDLKMRIAEAPYTIKQEVISIDPPTISVATNWTTKFVAKGGYPPYTFSVSSGHGKIDASSGSFSSDTPGSGIIHVTDSGGSSTEATFTVYQETITIETKTPSLTTAQTAKFTVKGGLTPYVFSVVSGPGQVDSSSGDYTSDAAGSAIVRVTDRGHSVADLVLSVFQAPKVDQTLPQLRPGDSSLLMASGGVGQLKYEMIDATGGSWMAKSHIFVAGPEKGTAIIRVTDALGNVTDTSLEILNDDLPTHLVAVGHEHSCVIRDGDVYCWGDNSHGQLGKPDPEFKRSIAPIKVAGLSKPVTSIAAGMYHTCAISKGGVQCWGANDSGQLGTGAFSQAHAPVPVFGLDGGVRGLVAGDYHTCAVLARGLLCWGKNDYAQLGHGGTETEPYPLAVKGIQRQRVNAAAGGGSHSCASASVSGLPFAGDEVLSCWGRNFSGQLGSGNTEDSVKPITVDIGSGVKNVVAGWAHSCAMLNDSVKCWGFNGIGSAGVKAGPNEIKPQVVPPVTGTMTTMAAGQYHTCAVASGSAYCWGYNFYGQVGSGKDQQNVSTPVKVMNLPDGIVDIATGDQHTCAVREGGDTYCWGNNEQGQLGDREYDLHVTPFQVNFDSKKKKH